jgi:hypothetical protein
MLPTNLPALREAVAQVGDAGAAPMTDHIFSVSVKSRIKDARASMNKAYDAYAHVHDQGGGYARELLALAQLHQRVLRVWQDAVGADHD